MHISDAEHDWLRLRAKRDGMTLTTALRRLIWDKQASEARAK